MSAMRTLRMIISPDRRATSSNKDDSQRSDIWGVSVSARTRSDGWAMLMAALALVVIVEGRVVLSSSAEAQRTLSRTAWGDPDLQGYWATGGFAFTLEKGGMYNE